MDAKNTFDTRATAGLARLESGSLLLVCAALTVSHLDEVSWTTFVGLFLVIDVIGYLPGMIAYRRSNVTAVHRVYYVLYNVMHSLTTWTVVLGLWVLVSGWQWALLAVPLHLLGDRALFGNSLKSFRVSFEPEKHPAFADFERRYERTPSPWPGRETANRAHLIPSAATRPATTAARRPAQPAEAHHA